MFKSILLLSLTAEICFAVDVRVGDLKVYSTKVGDVCLRLPTRADPITCVVLRGETVYLNATWEVYGVDEDTFQEVELNELNVTLIWSDGVGNINDIPVCLMDSSKFRLGESFCTLFIAFTGNYAMDLFKFTAPQSANMIKKTLSVKAVGKWSDGRTTEGYAGDVIVSLV